MAWLQKGLKVLHFVFCFSLTIWGGWEGRRSGREGRRNALFPHLLLPCLSHGWAQAVFSLALSSAPGKLPQGSLHDVLGDGSDLSLYCLHHSSPPPFLCPSLVQPVLPVEYNSSSLHLPRACPFPAKHWGTGDDAGEGSALQALL